MVIHYEVTLGPYPAGFHIVTEAIFDVVTSWPDSGMLFAQMLHTSAGLCINENADPTVRSDFQLFFNRLAPELLEGIQHDMEGPDDMPAHIKSTLTGSSIQIPIMHGKPKLGTWQGIYLCEFRTHASPRRLIISIVS